MKSTIKAGLVAALSLFVAAPLAADPAQLRVTAMAETEAVSGDADDPAIWTGPDGLGLILGTDKTAGLYVYGLDGAVRDFFPAGRLNNVDIRLLDADAGLWLAGATERVSETLVFWLIDATGAARYATPIAFPAMPPALAGEARDIYGFAMARDPVSGQLYALVNWKTGHIAQWAVSTRRGELHLKLARHWKVATQPEGMTSDDAAGHIYVGEEDAAIWRFPLDPAVDPVATRIDAIPSACLPRDDVEGLAIADDGQGGRFLLASAQGVNRLAVYRLAGEAPAPCIASVEIAADTVSGIDSVTETDGLEVTARAIGDLGGGLLVMMDDQNEGFTRNFKLIDWREIAVQLPR